MGTTPRPVDRKRLEEGVDRRERALSSPSPSGSGGRVTRSGGIVRPHDQGLEQCHPAQCPKQRRGRAGAARHSRLRSVQVFGAPAPPSRLAVPHQGSGLRPPAQPRCRTNARTRSDEIRREGASLGAEGRPAGRGQLGHTEPLKVPIGGTSPLQAMMPRASASAVARRTRSTPPSSMGCVLGSGSRSANSANGPQPSRILRRKSLRSPRKSRLPE